jgi:phosphatidylglycerol:prolipoprotein diacylglycerol transferase
MITYPTFNPIAVEIGPIGDFGPLKIHWYGIMYLIAFAAAWWLGRVRARQPNSTWKPADIDDFMFFGMLGTILGGRIGYVLFYGLSFWAEDKWYPLKLWDGGMSFHGGLLGVLLAFAIFAVRRKRRIADVFDFAAPLPGIGFPPDASATSSMASSGARRPPCRGDSSSTIRCGTPRSSTRRCSKAWCCSS